jgi:hypothetical protein
VAFALIVLAMVGAAVCGVLLAYDGTHHRSMTFPFALLGGVIIAAAVAGGVFGWTNKKSPRWREWRRHPTSQTPGWPPSGSRGTE